MSSLDYMRGDREKGKFKDVSLNLWHLYLNKKFKDKDGGKK